jgi:uncharacterized protein YdcH (DUF465 family)
MLNPNGHQESSHFNSVYSENAFLKRKITNLENKLESQEAEIKDLKRMKSDIDTIKELLRLPVQIVEPAPEKPTYKSTFSEVDDIKVKVSLFPIM